MISILIIIHCSNKFDEYTGNQYILEDNDHDRPEGACALYPSSMQGKSIFISMVYSPSSFVKEGKKKFSYQNISNGQIMPMCS